MQLFYSALFIIVLWAAPVQATDVDCDDNLRLAVSSLKRSTDYLSFLTPFINTLGETTASQSEVIFTEGWLAAIDALNESRADLAFVPQVLLHAVHTDEKLRPVAKTPGTDIVLITGKKSEIKSILHLGGKRVAVMKDSTGQLMASSALKKAGIINEVQFSAMAYPGDVFIGLFQGRFDAAFIAHSAMGWIPELLQDKIQVLAAVGETAGLYLYAGACVSDDNVQRFSETLLTRPEDVRVRAFLEQYNFESFIPVTAGEINAAIRQTAVLSGHEAAIP